MSMSSINYHVYMNYNTLYERARSYFYSYACEFNALRRCVKKMVNICTQDFSIYFSF